MSLDEYWRKRDFEHTPEPRGTGPRGSYPPLHRFVVQRHRATRLHYDFRLEIEGVLASWAVPRGPSMQPLVKRRAMRTEDHPLEYLDFEGVIPAGEYGGGDVIVWDHGAWEPEGHTDPAAAVEDGEFKLVLHGERLRGRFVLVRTGAGARGKEGWLLIHKRDEHAVEDWDIDDYPGSLLSGRTNEELAAGAAPVMALAPPPTLADIDVSAARQAERAAFVEPMLATPVERPFSDPDWLFELKLDGYRVQAVVHDRKASLWTRKHMDAAAWFPELAAAPTDWIAATEAVVDGEMVALDEHGRPSFSLLQDLVGSRGLGRKRRGPGVTEAPPGPREGTLVYHAFDLLNLDGWDLLDVPLEERKRLLRLVLVPHPSVRLVSHVLEHGEQYQAAVMEQGLEGSVAKLRRGRYEPGRRSQAWLKVKIRREQELVLVGYEPGAGSHAELGSVLVATREAGEWRYAGAVGSGIGESERRLLRELVDEHPLSEPPVAGAPDPATARWCEPRHVIRVEFAEWTPDGLLRQAVYKGREVGRDAHEVRREATGVADVPVRKPATAVADAPSEAPSEAATDAELEALEGLGQGGTWMVGGHTVELTNLDKVLFPEAGFTKRDLVRYYTTITPVILPYLRERPLNVHRWPDGVEGKTSFWQKQIPAHAPAWVARWQYPDAGRSQSHVYVVADRVATMAWLANQAVIDLHPWNSRLPDYWRPSYAFIDIDPGERTSWAEVLTLARLYRTALDHLGVHGFPKVTGSRGIQVWIKVQPRYTYDETREWVGELSRGVAAVVPDLVSWEWSKSERGGRARLDYTQNSMIKTLVAPYAVRPVPRGAVSAPITWDELDDPALDSQRWDIRTILERVAERGDLFAGVLDDPQELPSLS